MPEPPPPLGTALEQWIVSLGASGALPVAELVRVLERTAERLRSGDQPGAVPEDLVSQSEAARLVGVSRQAVHQWVSKGLVNVHNAPNGKGRQAALVSLSDVVVAANRRREAALPVELRRQLLDFIEVIGPRLPGQLVEGLAGSVEPEPSRRRAEDASRVLREFVTAAMGSSSVQQEFSEAGVQMLARFGVLIEVDADSEFGRLAESLGLLVHSNSGSSGFDSAATAVLGLLGCATIGVSLRGPEYEVGGAIALAARDIWGEDWVTRLFDVAYHLEQLSPSPLTRYTASLSYLGTNRFYRQAQPTGVSIAYGRTPGVLVPQSYYGEPFLSDRIAGRLQDPVWAFSHSAAGVGTAALGDTNVNPFRTFSFERGLLDRSIHGVRRYCYSAPDARHLLRSYAAGLSAADRRTYADIAVTNLARAIESPFIEVVAFDRPRDFDWWKDHIIRSSEREILIGLRDVRARTVAHALLVQTAILPDVVEAAEADNSLRDRLRIYVKNLEFGIVRERYDDDIRRGAARVIKLVSETVSASESRNRAQAEITWLLDGEE